MSAWPTALGWIESPVNLKEGTPALILATVFAYAALRSTTGMAFSFAKATRRSLIFLIVCG